MTEKHQLFLLYVQTAVVMDGPREHGKQRPRTGLATLAHAMQLTDPDFPADRDAAELGAEFVGWAFHRVGVEGAPEWLRRALARAAAARAPAPPPSPLAAPPAALPPPPAPTGRVYQIRLSAEAGSHVSAETSPKT